MYARNITYRNYSSFFVFGARGVGKSLWAKTHFPEAITMRLIFIVI
jgi:hypothetical protein